MMSEHGHIKFWQEIGRRNVLRVAAVYVGFSWAVVHSGVVVGEALELPHWIMRFVSAVLIVGFPAVVAFAWVYEITPDGLKRAEEVERDKSITHRTAHRLNIVIIALIVLLAGLYGADRFLLSHEGAEGAAHVAAEGAAKAPAGEGVSIAVLPFLNLSSDKEQEFFADGMTEEITSALAKVKGLRVVGRTSAFAFKGQNKDLHAIGQELRAANLLEGSVRKEGNQIRVTAQLIKADDGTHIWTEDYDRELKSVFAIQDDVSKAIARALQVPLGLKEGATLVADRAIDADSYQDYLRAKALHRAPSTANLEQSISLLEDVVARNPDYAPAWALLSLVVELQLQGQTNVIGTGEVLRALISAHLPKVEKSAHRAVELDPGSALAQAALGVALQHHGKQTEAEDAFKRALEIDPDNADALHSYSLLLMRMGRIKAALPLRQKATALEPLTENYIGSTAAVFTLNGQSDAAISLLNAARMQPNANSITAYADAYAAVGRYAEAAAALQAIKPGVYPAGTVEAAVRLLRTAPAPAASPEQIPWLGRMEFVYLYVGASQRLMDSYELPVTLGLAPVQASFHVWLPAAAPVRKTERFKALARKAGWLEYWRARGWPDLCHPVGTDDFECS